MVNQLTEGYYTKSGELNVEDNAELKDRFELLASAVAGGQSAAQAAWDWNGGKSFVDGTFATFVCPRLDARCRQRARSKQVAVTPPPAGTSPMCSPAAQPTGVVRS